MESRVSELLRKASDLPSIIRLFGILLKLVDIKLYLGAADRCCSRYALQFRFSFSPEHVGRPDFFTAAKLQVNNGRHIVILSTVKAFVFSKILTESHGFWSRY